MGYTTEFQGQFTLSKPLTAAQAAYLTAFAESRRMRRNATKTSKRADPLREAVGLPVGPQGGFFVNEDGDFGQGDGDDVTDHNSPPSGQPGLWCQWVPTEDGEGIEWDGNEKFNNYRRWLDYITKNFLNRWGITLSGEVSYQGEEPGDSGFIVR
jgi:hypothetical protein